MLRSAKLLWCESQTESYGYIGVGKEGGREGKGFLGRRDGSKIAEARKEMVWVVSVRQMSVARI